MSRFRTSRTGLVLLAAATGTLGHVLAYVLLFHDAHERAEALHQTGHDYLSFLVAPLAVAAIAGLGMAFARGWCREPDQAVDRGGAFRFLAAVHAATFLGSELIERGLTGELFTGQTLAAFAAGLAIETVLAALAALLYSVAAATGRILAATFRARPRAATTTNRRAVPLLRARASQFVLCLTAPRAPPASHRI